MLRIILTVTLICVILAAAVYMYLQSSQFGALPAASDWARYERSPQFDREKRIFRNVVDIDFQKNMDWGGMLKAYWNGGQIRTPNQPLPEEKPDFATLTTGTGVKWIWLGHSSLYLNLDGRRILVDPVLHAASPLPFMVQRFVPAAAALEQLPPAEIVIISHDHYDHLDAEVIRGLARMDAQFVIPLGLAPRLRGWGVPEARIHELAWHEAASFGDLSITVTPSQHFSGRSPFDRARTLWASFVLKSLQHKIFYSGDSGYSDHFKAIGQQYGPFDLGFLEGGQYSPFWRFVHMLPEDLVAAGQDLGLKNVFPVHWGMFNLSIHDWFEPIEEAQRLGTEAGLKIWTSRIGALSDLSQEPQADFWWREHPDYKKRKGL